MCGGVWRVVEGCGGLWRVVEGCGGLWRVVEGCGGLWRVVEGCGGLWRVVEGCGGLWRVVEGCGGLWRSSVAAKGCRTLQMTAGVIDGGRGLRRGCTRPYLCTALGAMVCQGIVVIGAGVVRVVPALVLGQAERAQVRQVVVHDHPQPLLPAPAPRAINPLLPPKTAAVLPHGRLLIPFYGPSEGWGVGGLRAPTSAQNPLHVPQRIVLAAPVTKIRDNGQRHRQDTNSKTQPHGCPIAQPPIRPLLSRAARRRWTGPPHG